MSEPLPKVFVGYHVAIPGEWREAAGFPRHQQQGQMLVVAYVKRDIPALLTDRKLSQGEADSLTAQLRLRHMPYDDHVTMLAGEVEIVDLYRPGVHVWREGQKNDAVLRIEPDGTPVVVGHFRHDPIRGGRGLYVEPVSAEEQ
uniref:hypothetical protein n=1 Tax=Nonomuraea sp. CA-251285 TaxID=3240002 RepID=UPI003F497FEE